MAIPGEPADLPGLIALLFRADWTRLSLSAVVTARHDLGLRREMAGDRYRAAHPDPSLPRVLYDRWIRPADPGSDLGPDHGPDVTESRGRLLLAPGGRYRTEVTGDGGDPARAAA
jgi:hypothetical protein